ncbi:MAG TPA: biotin carboxylase N-terminal domain-containing protein [Polyangiaceae bacterium]|jgi:acetyl-CoA carboxylase biotin carboxylase subunit/3-methylcrotonyl-CoA carboxylase alpha subunit|nr:biotin carboxylase N-terminal domain-containing protein [Polyangiaceae bacterium]
MFKKVLVANRGEIACRIFRTCERLGIPTVAVFSDADVLSPHVAQADEAIRIGPAKVSDSYLSIPAILAAIGDVGADAVHPGYGLLSERRTFADAVRDAGAVFIGPPSEALEAFGDKIKARQVARSVGVSPPPGSERPVDPKDASSLKAEAERIGLPLLIKAAAGGGGIGMQIVRDLAELERAAQTCADRGLAAFGDGRIYLERYLEGPRHIEVQVFCDEHGNAVALGERECSVQRRHQKIIEESPSPAGFFSGPSGAERRSKLFSAALSLVRAANYRGAGTVEFVANREGELYFLEVNARLQVEHPVSELVTGLDLVELQLRVAAGESLPASALTPQFAGHAIEVRLYAEDPQKGFLPQPGVLQRFDLPNDLPGVRIDSGVIAGQEITPHYDPMLAKIAAHGPTREQALQRLQAALAECRVELVGPKGPRATNLAFLQKVLASAEFRAGEYDTSLAETLNRS